MRQAPNILARYHRPATPPLRAAFPGQPWRAHALFPPAMPPPCMSHQHNARQGRIYGLRSHLPKLFSVGDRGSVAGSLGGFLNRISSPAGAFGGNVGSRATGGLPESPRHHLFHAHPVVKVAVDCRGGQYQAAKVSGFGDWDRFKEQVFGKAAVRMLPVLG